jgi:hypothetical protein
MPGRTKRQNPPLKKTARRPRPSGKSPDNRTQPKQQTYGLLVDVALEDHSDKALRPGPKQNLT